MNHGYYQDRLSAYFDQALTPEELQMMTEHLASCAECRGRLDELAKLDQLIEENAGLGESDYWEDSAQSIESRIDAAEAAKVTGVRSGWFGLGWKLAAAAASVAALTFVALHEGEIQDSATKPDRVADIAMAPSPTIDSGLREIGNDIEFETDEIADDIELESAGEPARPKDESSGAKKASPSTVVPPTPTVAEELEGKASAEAAWQDADDKRVTAEKPDLHTVPVTSVDELLEQVAGVVTDSSGEIFIRGGRAGEVAYIVDGAPTQDTEEVVVDLGTIELVRKKSDIGKTISVQGQRDVIDKFEVSNQATITRESLAITDDTPTLEGLRAKFRSEEVDTSLKARIMRQPVTSVEELLEQVEGVVTNKDGEIFIRGAGEVGYIVEGVPHSGVLGGLGDAGANLSLPPHPADSLDPDQKLSWWRAARDSLQRIIESPQESTFNRTQKSAAASDGIADAPVPPAPVSESTKPPNGTQVLQYLKACFKIAELTDRESEYDSAWFAIAKYANDDDSPLQKMARHYIERLAIIEQQRLDQE